MYMKQMFVIEATWFKMSNPVKCQNEALKRTSLRTGSQRGREKDNSASKASR